MIKELTYAFRRAFKRELSTIEKFKIIEIDCEYLCRVDPGAHSCSVHAKDIQINETQKTVSFRHAGITHILPLLHQRLVKNANGSMLRPKVRLTFDWNGKTYKNIETSLVDRSGMTYKVLIGRNLLRQIDLPIRLSDSEQTG